MKNYLIILCVLIFACKDAQPSLIDLPPEESQIIMVKLEDSLGTISITLPKRYDTSFTWVHHSDCGKSCDEIKYRFQPKYLPIHRETGFYWIEPKDSVENFTITHSAFFYPGQRSDSAIFHVHQQEKIGTNQGLDKSVVYDTVSKVSDRFVSIVCREVISSDSILFKQLKAQTYMGNNRIQLIFELKTNNKNSQTDAFLNNTFYYIKQISISDHSIAP